MNHHEIRHANDTGDRGNIADVVEAQIIVQGCTDAVGGPGQEQRVTIGLCAHNKLGGEIAVATQQVLDEERLLESNRKPLADQTSENVVRAGRGKADYNAHGPRRISLSLGETPKAARSIPGKTTRSRATSPVTVSLTAFGTLHSRKAL
jgi:hypothetical protein